MAKDAQVRRILDRYLVEIVERYELCPWARAARTNGELTIAIVYGTPSLEAWIEAARGALANPTTRVAMVVAPELAITRAELHEIRDRVAEATVSGVAEFHPDAALELGTPARLVPFLRRSPDPMLQLVPLALLATMRAALPSRARQAQILAGHVSPPRDAGERIAADNHATVCAHRAAMIATLDDITADRRRSY